jgi:hypothetical protein
MRSATRSAHSVRVDATGRETDGRDYGGLLGAVLILFAAQILPLRLAG